MSMLMVLVTLLCLLAAVLEIACMRSPSIPDNELSLVGRRILIAGLLLLVLRLTWITLEGQSIHIVGLLGIGMIAFGNVIRCANRLATIEPLRRIRPGPPRFLRGTPGDEAP